MLNKVTINQDSFGDIISLTDSAILELRYYRNNILHTFILPSLVCRLLERNAKISQDDLLGQIQRLVQLLKTDLFLWQSAEDVEQQVKAVCQFLTEQNIAKQSKAGFWSLSPDDETRAKVRLIAERLSVLNNINAPEFIDKKAQSTLILAMKEQGYIVLDDNDKLVDSSTLGLLKSSVSNLVDIEVLQSIIR